MPGSRNQAGNDCKSIVSHAAAAAGNQSVGGFAFTASTKHQRHLLAPNHIIDSTPTTNNRRHHLPPDPKIDMLIRRLPQPSFGRKCVTFLFGPKVEPAIETLNVIRDNMELEHKLQHNPHAFDRLYHLYQVRYVSAYQKALKDALVPEKRDELDFSRPVHVKGMVYPNQRVTWTT